MLHAKIIHPSRSPSSFPLALVEKDGTKRLCIDFRKLNNITKKSNWFLPVTDDMISALGKEKYFTILDLKSGHW